MGAKLFVPLIDDKKQFHPKFSDLLRAPSMQHPNAMIKFLQIMCNNMVVFLLDFHFLKSLLSLRILNFAREKQGFGGEFEIGTEDQFKDNSIR